MELCTFSCKYIYISFFFSGPQTIFFWAPAFKWVRTRKIYIMLCKFSSVSSLKTSHISIHKACDQWCLSHVLIWLSHLEVKSSYFLLNPLALKSEKHLISPESISPESNIKVTRKQMATRNDRSNLFGLRAFQELDLT